MCVASTWRPPFLWPFLHLSGYSLYMRITMSFPPGQNIFSNKSLSQKVLRKHCSVPAIVVWMRWSYQFMDWNTWFLVRFGGGLGEVWEAWPCWRKYLTGACLGSLKTCHFQFLFTASRCSWDTSSQLLASFSHRACCLCCAVPAIIDPKPVKL